MSKCLNYHVNTSNVLRSTYFFYDLHKLLISNYIISYRICMLPYDTIFLRNNKKSNVNRKGHVD